MSNKDTQIIEVVSVGSEKSMFSGIDKDGFLLVRYPSNMSLVLKQLSVLSKINATRMSTILSSGNYFVKVHVMPDTDLVAIERDIQRAWNGYIQPEVGLYPSSILSDEEIEKDKIFQKNERIVVRKKWLKISGGRKKLLHYSTCRHHLL
jgi:hypothetical protein